MSCFNLTLTAVACWGIGNVIRITQKNSSFSMLSLIVWASAVSVFPLALLSLFLEGYGCLVVDIEYSTKLKYYECTTLSILVY